MIKEEKKYFGHKAKNREKMINRVYKGIPDSVRGKVWYILLDIDRIKKEQEGTYRVIFLNFVLFFSFFCFPVTRKHSFNEIQGDFLDSSFLP